MPSKKKISIGKNTVKSTKVKMNRIIETPYNRENRQNANRSRSHDWRTCANLDIREIRREADRLRKIESRRAESSLNREISLNAQRIRMQTFRQALGSDLKMAALNYVKEFDYRYFILFRNFFRICKSKIIIEFDYKIIVNTQLL